jgi:hypothetical protein
MPEALVQKARKRFTGIKKRETGETGECANDSTCCSKEELGKKAVEKRQSSSAGRKGFNSIPSEILENEELKKDISESLPANYNFEIYKSGAHHLIRNEKSCCY